jgi:EmrB/QacA subfamily drug resistance transporter
MIILDGTVVNVALPSLRADLGLSPAGLAWVVNAYLVPFGGLLLLSGRFGDLLGRKRVFLTGLVIFTVASLLCGMAQTPTTLLAARFAQGVGGAVTSSVTLGMVVTLFPEAKQRAKAIGVYSFVQSAGGTLGQLAGGVLTQALNWHWIFFVNVPIGIVAVLFAVRVLAPERGIGFGKGADAVGGLLITAALMAGVYAIVETGTYGWTSAHTIGFGALAAVLLAGFVIRQATAAAPLVPLRLFRSRDVSGAMVIQALMVAGMFGFQFLCVQYLQRVLGLDQLRTGLALLPVSTAIGAISLVAAPRLIARFGSRSVLLPGLTLIALGLLMLSWLPADGAYLGDVLPSLIPLGVGFGLAMPALATLAMSASTPEDSGIASGMFNTMQQVGSAFGLAILSTLAASRTESLLRHGESAAAALTGGYRLAFGLGTVFTVAALVPAAMVLRTVRATRNTPAEPPTPADAGQAAALDDSAAR